MRKMVVVIALVTILINIASIAMAFERPTEQSGQCVQDEFRKVCVNGKQITLINMINRVTGQGWHPPGQFIKKGQKLIAHSYEAFGDSSEWTAPRSVSEGNFADRLSAEFTFTNGRPKTETVFVGITFSSIPGGHANPDALWGISDWSVGKNLLLFTNGKEDYKVMFKVKDGVILTVIGEAYANGYFLVEDLETAKAKGASASLIKALESWRNLAGAESTAKTVFVNTIRP